MARSSRDEWRGRVAAWQASGLSCREFAAGAGLNRNTLSWWKWKLGSEVGRRDGGDGEQRFWGSEADGGGRRSPVGGAVKNAHPAEADVPSVLDAGSPDDTAATFFEVTSLLSRGVERDESGVGLALDCGGIRIDVPVGFDGPTLCRVLEILENGQ